GPLRRHPGSGLAAQVARAVPLRSQVMGMEASMQETATKSPEARSTTTAEDTLKRKSRDTSVICGGHLVARALKAEGVGAIFTLCGGHIIDIYDGCIDEGIQIVDVRHEQAAAHAADAWTRLTGVPGCAVVTAGPGTTDTVTAVANAWRAQSPMLVIGGQGALKQAYMGSLQELDHVSIMKPITKFAATVYHTERIPEMIGAAFRQAFN